MKYRITISLLLALSLNPHLSAQGIGDYEIDWDLVEQVAEDSHAAATDLVDRFELPVTLPPVEQLGSAMRLIVQTLEHGSVEDLARLAPFAHLAYEQLAREPRFAPYVH
ncbi:MAG: hypothetical protein PF795_07735, partial [Kiritimatiellae bacterium]|nr:hypothetical protein [Kiritimatiellia bacterium]